MCAQRVLGCPRKSRQSVRCSSIWDCLCRHVRTSFVLTCNVRASLISRFHWFPHFTFPIPFSSFLYLFFYLAWCQKGRPIGWPCNQTNTKTKRNEIKYNIQMMTSNIYQPTKTTTTTIRRSLGERKLDQTTKIRHDPNGPNPWPSPQCSHPRDQNEYQCRYATPPTSWGMSSF